MLGGGRRTHSAGVGRRVSGVGCHTRIGRGFGAWHALLLGDNILGTGFSFDIRINRGGGVFVCGESTALMASIEGFVGEPRARHIRTVVQGPG
jgi:hypothetical protein